MNNSPIWSRSTDSSKAQPHKVLHLCPECGEPVRAGDLGDLVPGGQFLLQPGEVRAEGGAVADVALTEAWGKYGMVNVI